MFTDLGIWKKVPFPMDFSFLLLNFIFFNLVSLYSTRFPNAFTFAPKVIVLSARHWAKAELPTFVIFFPRVTCFNLVYLKHALSAIRVTL